MKAHFSLLWHFYIAQFFMSLLFWLPIWAIFFQSRGLTLAEIGLVSSGVYIASFLIEYPSGVFADTYGRKKSIIIAIILSMISIVVDVTAHSLPQFFIGSILAGASWAFASGAKEAFVYDTLKEHNLEHLNSTALGYIDSIGAIGGVASALIGSAIFSIENTLPYWLTFFCTTFALLFISFTKESKHHENITHVPPAFTQSLRLVLTNPTIKSMLFLYIPLFFFEEAWFNASQPILVSLGLPSALLGAYYALRQICTGICGTFLPKLINKFRHRTLIAAIIILESTTWLALGASSLAAVFLTSYGLIILHQFWTYVDADIIHKHIPSSIRASTLSARQMIISSIWLLNPWLMGTLVNSFDRTWLFSAFAAITLITTMIVLYTRKQYV